MKASTVKIALIAYFTLGLLFFILHLVGLTEYNELRLLNVLIVIYFSNHVAKDNYNEINEKGYFQNFISLFRFNMLIVLLAMVSLFVYTSYIDTAILAQSESLFTIIPAHTESELLFALFAEGLSASVVVSYGILQYWKNPNLSSKPKTYEEFLKS